VGEPWNVTRYSRKRGCREWYILELSFTPLKKGKEEVIDSQDKEATSLE